MGPGAAEMLLDIRNRLKSLNMSIKHDAHVVGRALAVVDELEADLLDDIDEKVSKLLWLAQLHADGEKHLDEELVLRKTGELLLRDPACEVLYECNPILFHHLTIGEHCPNLFEIVEEGEIEIKLVWNSPFSLCDGDEMHEIVEREVLEFSLGCIESVMTDEYHARISY